MSILKESKDVKRDRHFTRRGNTNVNRNNQTRVKANLLTAKFAYTAPEPKPVSEEQQ